jgi:hypothetical protein
MFSAISATLSHADTTLAQLEAAREDLTKLMHRMSQQQQRIIEMETEISLLEEDRDAALEIILWPFLCQHETTEQTLAYLHERGLNPRAPEHAEEIAAFLERRAEVENAVLEVMQEGEMSKE